VARSIRSTDLETRTNRLRLPVARKPVFVRIAPKVGLGYRRNQTAGTWVARVADGRGGNWTKAIGSADDFEEADDNQVLDFWQAQRKARSLGRYDRGGGARPMTVGEALVDYEADLLTRGGDSGNLMRIQAHLPPILRDKAVALLGPRDLRVWRDALLKQGLAPSSVNRTCTVLKAALNLAADHDERITDRRAWETGLAKIPDAEQSRNVVLDEATVRWLIAEAYTHSAAFGLLVELAAVTGARVSQLARLEVQDLQAVCGKPRLLMPTSRKGKGTKKILRYPVPIPAGLAARLRDLVDDRAASSPLLLKSNGVPWAKSDQRYLFKRVARVVHRDPAEVTIYALRHSNIVRQLLAGVPIRVVAVNHDTSVTMIERTYSRYIADHSDQLARSALLDTSVPPGGNVVAIHASAPLGSADRAMHVSRTEVRFGGLVREALVAGTRRQRGRPDDARKELAQRILDELNKGNSKPHELIDGLTMKELNRRYGSQAHRETMDAAIELAITAYRADRTKITP
jgi:integrase